MITVTLAVELPESNDLLPWALPKGFPILLDDELQQVIEPALHYLIAKHLRKRGRARWNLGSAKAEAYDLRSWFDFLQHLDVDYGASGKPWDLANENDYVEYREQLHDLISNITHRPLADNTIRRMQITVESFYAFAIGRGLYQGEFLENKIKKGRSRPAESDALLHTRSGRRNVGTPAYREETGPHNEVHALTAEEWNLVSRSLGPLPSEASEIGSRSRDRLAAELSCGTGLRVDEVAQISINQVLDLDAKWRRLSEEDRLESYVDLYLTKTKGLKPRTVLVPGYLVPEIMLYCENERRIAVDAGKAIANKRKKIFREPRSLFVNNANAGFNAGNLIRPSSLSHAFSVACRACGLLTRITRTDPETMELYSETVSAHSFHDLRHTFAVWKYTDAKNRALLHKSAEFVIPQTPGGITACSPP
ncbi:MULTISPECIES: tyrosine-type recombinase/integrase [Massilia]|uniref:tyrosine-type recombinase/integrase n=1 Tax=Massilia TaxID=149698 RepID=UPI001C62F7DC|nr:MULTISPECIES: tyrosine-type recombinase/integrase [Massilia]QYF99987.1 site-specific integrase [Massilia sp. NP310]